MKQDIKEIVINGVTYTPKAHGCQLPMSDVVIVRTAQSGVFYGRKTSGLDKLEHGIVELEQARRVWFWSGAASLSQMAVSGVSRPGECKFPCAVPSITLLGVIEVIPVSEGALASLNSVPEWSK